MGAIAMAPLLTGRAWISSGLLCFDLRRNGGRQRRRALDQYLSRLQRLRDLSNKLDRQEAVSKVRSVHPDVICKFEPVFEWTPSDPAMEVTNGRYLLFLAGYSQQVGLEGDIEIVLGEAGNRY